MFALMEYQCRSQFGIGQIRERKMDKDNLAFIGTCLSDPILSRCRAHLPETRRENALIPRRGYFLFHLHAFFAERQIFSQDDFFAPGVLPELSS